MEFSLTLCKPQSAPSSSFPMPVVDSDVESDKTLWELYERWMAHCKVSRTLDERQKRFAEFRKNVEYIYSENKTDNFPYELQLNKYSDMTIEEYESKHPSVGHNNFKHLEIHDSDVASDETLQRLYKLWMTRYQVFRSSDEKLKRFGIFKEQVKYIHSENKKDGNLYRLGLNQFSDMTWEELDKQEMGVSPSEMLSMYSDKEYFRNFLVLAPTMTCDGYRMVPSGDEEALIEAVNNLNPVCALFDARGDAFKNYRGGVLTVEHGKEPGYVANIYGYGVTPCGVKFWEILCSFGPVWGENDHMRMKRGVNLCGIASFLSYPVINFNNNIASNSRG